MSNKGRVAHQFRSHSANTHRADIDGLRAVAIAGVLTYHFGLGVPGGYGGVDVFFVISGFLIAGIIKAEIEAETFSIGRFYVRRIRRILPALIVCALVTTAFATVVLFPHDFRNYGRSLLAAATSTSNFYFMHRTGYFDGNAIEKPLLHTWSLGVEEQFYAVFPLLLLFLFRLSHKAVLPALGLIAFASLGYSIYSVGQDASEAFFSTAARVWELALGALLALGVAPQFTGGLKREVEAAFGAAMIAFAFFMNDDATPFPGLAALPLCFGAALIIHAGAPSSPPTMVGRLLSSRPTVGLGLISYSVYLWHWPLLVLCLYRFPQIFAPNAQHSTVFLCCLAMTSIVLGVVSWRFIEQPFRQRTTKDTRIVFAYAAAATAALAVISLAIVSRPAWLQHWPANIEAMQFKKTRSGEFFGLRPLAGWPKHTFRVGTSAIPPDAVLWGDSHGEALIPGFVSYYRETGREIVIATDPGCAPLPGVTFYKRKNGDACEVHNEAVFKKVLEPSIKRIILIARWADLALGMRRDSSGKAAMYDDDRQEDGKTLETVLEALVKRLTVAANREVVILGPVPEQAFDVTPAIARNVAWAQPLSAGLKLIDFLQREKNVLSVLAGLDALPHVTVIYPHLSLCDTKVCRFSKAGKALYSDSNHLTAAGVDELHGVFAESFGGATASVP